MDATLGGVAGHGAEFFVNEGLAADEQEVTDVVFNADIDDVAGFLEGDAAPLFGVKAVDGKAAKVAFGVADVGDGELEIAGAAVIENLAEDAPPVTSGTGDGSGGLGSPGLGC